MHLIIPKNYNPVLNLRDTEIAIKLVKDFFETELARALNLTRVSAPIMVTPGSGLNDNLNGVERPVSFDVLETGETAEIVHSLAKWKRQALKTYGFQPGEGLYTDMNAIRRDETTDNIHSIFVDQWEKTRKHMPALAGLSVAIVALAVFGANGFMLPALLITSAILVFAGQKEGAQ